MGFIRGRWKKRYINDFEDKRILDEELREHFKFRSEFARKRCLEDGHPELSPSEKEDVDSFWGRYGIRINDYSWFRMYYAVTGIRDPRFMPDDVMGLCVYSYYNDSAYADAWRDKNMFERLLPQVPFPEAVGRRVRGRYLTPEGSVLDVGEFARHLLERAGGADLFVKDARLTGHGRGVGKYSASGRGEVEKLLVDWSSSDNYVIQRCVKQHEVFARFNESSVNIVRVVTWRHGGDVEVLLAALRYGMPGEIADDCMRDGEEVLNVVGVGSDGFVGRRAYDLNGRVVAVFDPGLRVPSWEKIVRCAKEAHLGLDNFDVVGWDFTVDSEGNPICLEYNIQWPGTVVYQFACGPFAGEFTGSFLSFLEDEENRENYIPHYMRL